MSSERSRTALAGTLLCLAPLLVYLPLASAGFIWDDDAYVTRNPNLGSLAGLVRIWLDPLATPQYYPLVHTTFWLEHRLFGLEPLGYHAVNVLLHGLSSVLLWRVLLQLRLPGAFLAASLFAAHPVMTESVAWVTERKNVLSLALALGSLWSYLRYAPLVPGAPGPASKRPRRGLLALAGGLYAAALLSKTTACALPAVILVLTWWKRGRIRMGDVMPLLPFFALGFAAGLHTIWLEKHHVGALGGEWALSPLGRVLLAGRALVFYTGKLAWPHPLIFFYPRWEIDVSSGWQWLYPIGVAALAAALYAARARIGRGPLAAMLLYAGVLFPALGFFDVYPFRYSYVADHFQYAASPAPIALFSATVATGVARLGPFLRVPAFCAALLLVAGLGVLSYRQAGIYRDLETLYGDTIRKNPGAWQAYINLANHLSGEGRHAEALGYAREAVRTGPKVADAHNTLGAVLVATSTPGSPGDARLAGAIEEFSRAMELEPEHVDALYNLSVALTLAGRHGEAAAGYARILQLRPGETDALTGLGRALLAASRPEEAEAPLRRAAEARPTDPQAQNDLGVALARLGRLDEALSRFAAATRLAPDFPDARANLERTRRAAAADR